MSLTKSSTGSLEGDFTDDSACRKGRFVIFKYEHVNVTADSTTVKDEKRQM